MPRPKRAENNYYETPRNDRVYEDVHVYSNPANELGMSSLDVAAFTVNSSVYKNPQRRTKNAADRCFEPLDYMDAVGKESLKSSRKMRWLVALNAVLSVLTLFCLGLTSFVCYKVIIKKGGCKECDHSQPTGMSYKIYYEAFFLLPNFRCVVSCRVSSLPCSLTVRPMSVLTSCFNEIRFIVCKLRTNTCCQALLRSL